MVFLLLSAKISFIQVQGYKYNTHTAELTSVSWTTSMKGFSQGYYSSVISASRCLHVASC